MLYRKDIQILRGIAVLLVVLYHLDIKIFSSGFIGVDVFFVISGFLMSILYDKDNKVEFYRRRAARLLPAYFVTIILTLLLVIFITTPNEYRQVFSQAVYSGLFMPNINFWSVATYFSKNEFNPLLHLWSLGVELQYYLAIPIIYFYINKGFSLLLLLFALSIFLCFLIVEISPKTSFFMMPFRVWEFLIGHATAKYLSNNGAVKKIEI